MFLLRAVGMVALVVAPWAVMSAQTSAAAATRATADTGVIPGVGVVTGVVFDSVANVPLRDAVVQIRLETGAHTVYSAVTDSSGTYRMEQVPPGSYVGVFFHSALDRLGLEPIARRVTIGGAAVTRVDYAIPPPPVIWAAACPPMSPRDSSGVLLGRLHDADTGRPLAGGVVVVTWVDLVIDRRGLRRQREQLTTRSTDDGRYVLCGIPAGTAVLARAELGTASSGFIELLVPPRGLVQRDFGIGMRDSTLVAATDATDSTAAPLEMGASIRYGTARIDGTVRSPSGDPVAGVRVLVRGSAAEGTTDAQGQFNLADVPAGTFTLEARRLGFAPTRVIVDLASHRTTTVTVTLNKEVPVLDAVQVYGKRSNRRSLTGFLERRQRGFGHFITRADIENQHAFELSDLLRRIPGVWVVPTAIGFGETVVMRGGGTSLMRCIPVVYMDGMRIYVEAGFDINSIVNLHDISGVEVYRGAAETPPQFQGNGCGAVLIWTGS